MTEGPGAVTSPGSSPSRVLVWTALAVCVVGVLMVLLGAWRTGISTDEPIHVLRYDNLQEHGWYLLDDDFDGDEPGSWVTDQYVYGPVFTQVMHVVNRVVGLDPPGALGTSVDAYAGRHMVVALCGLLAVVAVMAIGRRLLGSWAWGLVAAATLMAIPMWPGLLMFDIKDVPAATGYTLVTWGLVEMLFRERPGWRGSLGPLVALTAGLVLGIGARPGLWPGLAASLGIVGLLALGRTGAVRVGGRVTPLAQLALACVLAYVVLWIAYPAYYSRPDEWVLGSVLDSTDYVAGPSGDGGGSWTYLPTRVVALMPPVLLVVGVLGCLTALPRRWRKLTPATGGWLLVASQALLLPALAVVGQSLLYDGLRQVLFACPAVALLLTLGWRSFVTDLSRDHRLMRRALPLVWSAALLVPVAVQVQLFPFNYAYAAPYASALGENDYWRVSYRELLPQAPRGDFVACYPHLSGDGETMRYLPPSGRPLAENASDCRTHPSSTLTPFELAASDDDRFSVQDTFIALFNRGQRLGSNCRELGSVERRRYFQRVVMSQVARCDLVLEPYPEKGADLGPDGSGAQYLLGGWTSHPQQPGIQLVEPVGSLGFELPEGWAASDLRVHLEGLGAGTPEMRINNEHVRVAPEGDGWVAEVPADIVGEMGEGRLVVTVAPAATGGALGLSHVSLEPL